MVAYTIPEAARAAGLSAREVRLRIEEGDLRAFVRAGRRMVEQAEIDRLLAAAPQPVKTSDARAEDALELARVKRAAAQTRARDAAEVRRLEQELGEARRELARARQRIEELESARARPALTALFQSTE
jgi:hypothetical protein